MNWTKRSLSILLMTSLIATQVQAAPFETVGTCITDTCSNVFAQVVQKSTRVVARDDCDAIMTALGMSALGGLFAYEFYKIFQEDPSTRIISAPAFQFSVLVSAILGAAALKQIYNS